MRARLYWFPISHPAQAVRAMLELKGIPYVTTTLLPGFQPLVRLRGFPGITVPALVLDGRLVQGSREIARELDRVAPEPPLFPADPAARVRVEEAERWGEAELQSVPRRIFRWGLTRDAGLRAWLARTSGMPLADQIAKVSGVQARVFARMSGADEPRVAADLAGLPGTLDRADAWLEDGTLTTDPPNAATLQILSTVAFLGRMEDLTPLVAARPSGAAAAAIFPDLPGPVPAFLPPDLRPAAG